ncbi:3-hydroxyisobutyryl-CoA hydrolase 1 isoform X1 [Vitis vinifera]|uniref:3-hydroxyisobutyryl-CoA hydrolase 1 isoform X1 n=1 Tax=Vitis vinifera TaxID=29760 RepID=UPI00053F30AF|nr:3-hydroxyisobutyryl-CoA hydrolase 1 isoform X1 [Vitis vinifera]|eukprot:XP_010659004.1 PREDICTED: 3-hydroxyisobutyryl-CoA hydrolase 1 isoform X1 [Vitis vinifera]
MLLTLILIGLYLSHSSKSSSFFPSSLMASRFLSHPEPNQVLFEESSCVRKVILNRPHKLNSLTYEMISQILRNLEVYEKDPIVKLLILKGQGKTFCAGGDVVGMVLSINEGHWSFGASFYKKQLTLDYLLATSTKPLVSLINGIIMGGGAGLSMNSMFRVVTENTVFAMPEGQIGLFPDVGASYFLSRLPGYFGEYLGLTGARLDGKEMLACGLATHFVLSKDLLLLENALSEVASSDASTISRVISGFSSKISLKKESAYRRLETINKCFSRRTVEEILSMLVTMENEAANGDNKWIIQAISSMKSASPTSLKIFLKLIREGRTKELKDCLIQDYTIACHMFRRTFNPDFIEGSRAKLFEKGQQPKWEPSKLELVRDDFVNQYFEKVDDADWEYLELPARSNLAKTWESKL